MDIYFLEVTGIIYIPYSKYISTIVSFIDNREVERAHNINKLRLIVLHCIRSILFFKG